MSINTFNEKPLHASLKAWYAQPGDQIEAKLDGYYIDIIQGDVLVEIQSRSFSKIKRKLIDLTDRYSVRLVFPVPQEKWIIKLPQNPERKQTRRKSPKRGLPVEIFRELTAFPDLINHPNFSLEILMIQEEEIRRYDGKKGWRRKGWVTDHRRLLDVVAHYRFQSAADFNKLLPTDLPEKFVVSDLARKMKITKRLAGQMAYCLRQMGAIEHIGKQGNAYLYSHS